MRAVRATSLSWPSIAWLAEGKCGIVGEHCSEEVAMCKGGVDVSWTDVDQAEAVATTACDVLGAWLVKPRGLSHRSARTGARQQLSEATAFPFSHGCLPRTILIDAVAVPQSLQRILDMGLTP